MTAMGVLAYLEAERLAYQLNHWLRSVSKDCRGSLMLLTKMCSWPGLSGTGGGSPAHQKNPGGQPAHHPCGGTAGPGCLFPAVYSPVFGASWQALAYVFRDKLRSRSTPPPTIRWYLTKATRSFSGGNFHGQPIALAMDLLKIAMAELATYPNVASSS